MFENCSVMVISASDPTNIMRLELDSETQQEICETFSASTGDLLRDKTKILFDGSYKPEQDEYLCISNFKLADEIKDAIRDPLGVSAYEKNNGEYPDIKAIFMGERMQDKESERFTVAFQRFRKEQYISISRFNLFWNNNTFRREKNFGISITDNVDCCYITGELQFSSFYFARQIFDLSEYYRSATDNEVADFASDEHLQLEDPDAFKAMANTAIRRKIAMINDSEVLKDHSPKDIKRLAKQTGIDIMVEKGKIIIPNDKEKVKLILGFLDEEAYKGPFSQTTYLANSRRKVEKK